MPAEKVLTAQPQANGPRGAERVIDMSTQMYLMGGLVESRVPSDRDLMHLRAVRTIRREARAARRTRRLHRG